MNTQVNNIYSDEPLVYNSFDIKKWTSGLWNNMAATLLHYQTEKLDLLSCDSFYHLLFNKRFITQIGGKS